MRHLKVLLLFVSVFSVSLLSAQEHKSTKRLSLDPSLAPFYHGVASGDPLSDRVIIWTRVTTQDSTTTLADVTWYFATDVNFTNIIDSGTVTTNASKDYTVKVDVTGLQPATFYYYMFKSEGLYSVRGRTKTAPIGDISNLRFAVVSCADYRDGYFNAYESITRRNDIDAVIHLGDYIYEYGTGSSIPGREHEPTHEIIQLDDYRARYSHYRLDPDLRNLHQQYPFIVTWDDHETANNSWVGGAGNHDPATEGPWSDRKLNGTQAYEEWLPVRQPDPNNVEHIYRKIRYGNLADIIVLDTRLEGRELQGGTSNLDTNRTILGAPQLAWFKTQLSDTVTRWKIVAQQVMFAPLKAFGTAVNADQWDGYPAERQKVINHVLDNNIKNFVVLTGDIHTAWANNIPDTGFVAATGANSAGVEFVVTSVTSSSEYALLNSITLSTIQQYNPHIEYAELRDKGYMIIDINKDRTQSDFYYVSTITDTVFTTADSANWFVNNGERFLRETPDTATSQISMVPLAPQGPGSIGTVGVADVNTKMLIIGAYPNPFDGAVTLQYYTEKVKPTSIKVYDLAGKKVYDETITPTAAGINYARVNLQNLSKGNYVLIMENSGEQFRRNIVKAQ